MIALVIWQENAKRMSKDHYDNKGNPAPSFIKPENPTRWEAEEWEQSQINKYQDEIESYKNRLAKAQQDMEGRGWNELVEEVKHCRWFDRKEAMDGLNKIFQQAQLERDELQQREARGEAKNSLVPGAEVIAISAERLSAEKQFSRDE